MRCKGHQMSHEHCGTYGDSVVEAMSLEVKQFFRRPHTAIAEAESE